jgi:acyl-CoA thioesterase YciA
MTVETDLDRNPHPNGELALRNVALAADTNQHGLIHGGWLAAQMDMAASLASTTVAKGKVATVAIEYISFLSPIQLGAVVSCYARIRGVGRSSVRVGVEAWVSDATAVNEASTKVAEGEFIFVAIDDNGRTRAIPRQT